MGPLARAWRWLGRALPGSVRVRAEAFGGIVALERPPLVAFVDRDFLRRLGFPEHPLWSSGRETLSAPTEVHLTLTKACPAGCAGCYVDAREAAPGELDTAGMKALLDELADRGLFHVAMGGGESYQRPDLFELAAHARSRGLIPNVTTSGLLMSAERARRSRVFGQVNVSLDGLDELETAAGRPPGSAAVALRALTLLAEAGVRTGVNCVVTRQNLDHLPALARAVRRAGAVEIEFLRYKPSGRGRGEYEQRRLTDAQARAVYPAILALRRTARIRPRIDCSFLPMACHHGPDPERMHRIGMLGCEAGHHLMSIGPTGALAGCSFLEEVEPLPPEGLDLGRAWDASPVLTRYRGWTARAPEPCASCRYLEICRGGCRAVSAHVLGNPSAPDPECPRVVDHAAR